MTWSNRLRILASIVAIVLVLSVLTLVFNQRQSQAQSINATIEQPQYAIGAEYGGVIIEQQVELSDTVAAGDHLFTLSSPALLQDAANGMEASSNPAMDIDPAAGTIVYKATNDGKVTELDATEGSYITPGGKMATIIQSSPRTVIAEFRLSPRDYGRLEEGARAEILLPDNQSVEGVVTSASVTTQEGQAFTEVRIASEQLDSADLSLLAVDGAPVVVTVDLRDDGPLAGPTDALMDFLRKIGLR